jgi:alcohol dehydrogenase class IV
MDFEFAAATRIIFGPGKLAMLGELARGFGPRALVVGGRSSERTAQAARVLAEAQVTSATFHVPSEPTTVDVARGAELARNERCAFVVGIGGGSALDAAKAIAALCTNAGDLLDYLEVVGHGRPLAHPSAPCIAVPTTAGTGAEVTRNAVLGSPEHQFKVSLRSPYLLPKLALIDPQLTAELPPRLTASTGLDALTQLIEPYVSHRANPLTDGFCIDGLPRIARSLRRAWTDGRDAQSREDMSLAALLGGLALANAALGGVHGFAAPLGGMYSVPHGELCAALLPYVMAVNVRALRARQPQSPILQRYAEVAELLTGSSGAAPEDGIAWVDHLCHDLRIPRLRNCGVRSEDFPQIIEKASQASSMRGNPIQLSPDDLREILERSL